MELWLLVQQSDDAIACEVLYRRHMKALYSTIYKWVDNNVDAEDILQNVFLDVWDKRQQIHIKGSFFNYLYTITRNKVFDHVQQKMLNDRQLKAWGELNTMVATEEYMPGEASPIENLLETELQNLPAQMKQVYQLRFREQKSIPEIAGQLMVSPYTIKNHLQKIRKRIQAAAVRTSSFFLFLLF